MPRPSSAPSASFPIGLLGLLGMMAVVGTACAKQDSVGDDEIGGTTDGSDTTETDTTETDTSEADSESDEGNFLPSETETGEPEPLSCQEMLDCVFMCLGDLDCLQTCGEGFDPVEAQKAGALVACLVSVCVEQELCSLDDPTNPDCIGCIGFGLVLPEPPGCEAEAMACE